MKVKMLSLQCECGRRCGAFARVGLTDDRQLMFEWRCADCGKPVYALKGLADCWRECPATVGTVRVRESRPPTMVKILQWRLS